MSKETDTGLPTDLLVKKERDQWEVVVVLQDDRKEYRFSPPCVVTLGRESTNLIRIDHSSVSRRHARISIHEGATIEDLGSSNGTRVDTRILSAKETAYLRPESVIELGDALLLVRAPEHLAVTAPIARGVSGAMAQALELALAASRTALNVLITGPTGAGKRHTAERIAQKSPRAKLPFVALRVSAATDGAMLFGTHAGAPSPGVFELAGAGIVLLQGIEQLSAPLQARLEQTLASSTARREDGSTFAIESRMIATSSLSLAQLRQLETFDRVLLSRVAGVCIEVPSLRERRGEIRHLVEGFLTDAPRTGLGITDAALGPLLVHDWTENIRGLRDVIHRASLAARTASITPEDLGPIGPRGSAPQSPQEAEKKRILVALDLCAGNQTKAAKMLGISRRTLINRIEELDLPRPRKASIPE
jgi:two-component system, NtrC family, response regulator AtoC